MNEMQLVKYARAGDKQAFVALYSQYKDRLYRYAYYRLGNAADAEDAVSDCVLSAFRQIGKLRKPEAFTAWLFRILHCSCITLIEAQAAQRRMVALNSLPQEPSTDMQAAIEKTELQEALAILTDDERDIVLLSVVSGLTSKEIAAVTDYTAGAVRSKLSRSLAKMRNFLEG
jgi:RNA polymerase sigma-70 factor (ECF subfamily)